MSTSRDPKTLVETSYRLLDRTTNPFHRHIIQTYIRRLVLEVTGRAEEFLEFAVEDAHFMATLIVPACIETKGVQETKATLSKLKEHFRCFVEDSVVMVSDDGLFHSYYFHHLIPGSVMIELNKLEDQDGNKIEAGTTYERVGKYNHFIRFNSEGRIVQESNGQCGPDKLIKCSEDSQPTLEEVKNRLNPILESLPKWTPYSG
ncbi:hypothetical protein AKO1_014256 [Acrasis kona]|uniref:Uncharacterized protein n=1 Tax=Acrasis kona TaxID=1008807 RepID=A0AAW2Z0Y0_9EUKA